MGELLGEHDLIRPITMNILDVRSAIGASNLPTAFHERVAFNRAAIKRPDVLVFNKGFAGRSGDAQTKTRNRIAQILPNTTQIYLDDEFEDPTAFDIHLEINGGKIDGAETVDTTLPEDTAASDLRRKLQVIGRNDLFSKLDARNQRLLAFAAQWYVAEKGQRIFNKNERADSVYICTEGCGQLAWIDPDGSSHGITEVTPGRVIGDLAVIMNEPRQLDFVALDASVFLRIGADQFRSVVENDQQILLSLLRTVAGHLSNAADALIEARVDLEGSGSSHLPPPPRKKPADEPSK
jgi:putative ABC transport system ATP-binding protein